MCLLSFLDTHFEVYGVSYDVHLCRCEVVEDISVVPVHISHGILVFRESLVDMLLVVDISLSHAKDIGEHVSIIDGVSNPFDIAHVVFLSLTNLYVHVHVLTVVRRDTIGNDGSIAISEFVIFVYKVLLVFLEALWSIFLCLEERIQLSCLVRLLQSSFFEQATFNLTKRELFVSLDGDGVNFQFLLLVDINIENNHVLLSNVRTLADIDFSIVEALLIEVFLCPHLCSCKHVWSDLSSL